jgi:hypothetical protein
MKAFLFITSIVFYNTLSAQNVGIGIAVPTAKLHVNGAIKLEGLNLFEFGAGVAGKEVNAGKIGYNAFGQNALTFIGAGTSSANRAVYFYAEGGTTFSGPINIGGELQVNGNSGTSGQVLTSNGSSDPTWQNTALSNNTRFAVRYSETVSNTSSGSFPLTQHYNLNPTDVSIGANSFTINKTGLYHFDYYFHYSGASTTAPIITTFLSGVYPGNSNTFMKDEIVSAVTSGGIYKGNWNFSLDVHIIAPATISISRYFLNVSSFSVVEGDFTGHLISQ